MGFFLKKMYQNFVGTLESTVRIREVSVPSGSAVRTTGLEVGVALLDRFWLGICCSSKFVFFCFGCGDL